MISSLACHAGDWCSRLGDGEVMKYVDYYLFNSMLHLWAECLTLSIHVRQTASAVRNVKKRTKYWDLQCCPISLERYQNKGVHFIPKMATQTFDEWPWMLVLSLGKLHTYTQYHPPGLLAVWVPRAVHCLGVDSHADNLLVVLASAIGHRLTSWLSGMVKEHAPVKVCHESIPRLWFHYLINNR